MQRKQGQQEVSSDSYNFGLITFIQKQNDNETKMPLNFAHINFIASPKHFTSKLTVPNCYGQT